MAGKCEVLLGRYELLNPRGQVTEGLYDSAHLALCACAYGEGWTAREVLRLPEGEGA